MPPSPNGVPGNATGNDERYYKEIGFDHVLPKPFDLAAMERTLRRYVLEGPTAGDGAGAGGGK
jgi:hypothetical protein